MIDRDYVNRLIEATPIRLYVSGVDGARAFWPWRMNKAGDPMGPASMRRHREKSDHYVLDSNFNDESVTNRDVLDQAVDVGADAAVLADVYQQMEPTVDALVDGIELVDDHDFDGTIVLPLQAPHAECYRQVAPSAPDDVWWAVGGLKDEDAITKLEGAASLREAAGPDAHIHGLGYGVTEQLARAVRSNPGALDSIDNSTSVSNSIPPLSGYAEKMTITAAFATAKRLQDLRALTPFAERRPAAELRDDGQTGLEDLAATDGGIIEGEEVRPGGGD